MAVVLGVGVLPASVALASQGSAPAAARLVLSATHVSGFSTASGAVRVGGSLWSTVTVSPAAVRTVSVQYRRSATSRFTTASTSRTSASGRITVGLRPPAAGNWQFRVAVAASAHASGAVSSLRTVVATGAAASTSIIGFSTSPASVGVGQPVTDDVVIVPRSARVVYVQARAPGAASFVTQASLRSSSTGAVRAVYRPSTPGAWSFRLVLPPTATARGATSAARAITAVDVTAPGPVTGLHTTDVTATSVALAWSDPGDSDFAGVVIRRASGATAPATVTDGSPVAELGASASSFTDHGLTAGTQYSYAVFAHDGVPNDAGAANLTVTTTAAQTTAALAIGEHFGAATTKLTVGADASFDASGSFAAVGSTLVSGSVDYGDGSAADTFTPGDFWGTVHAYASTGVKTVTVTVTDSAGASDTVIAQVTVFNAPTTQLRITSGAAHVGVPVTFATDASAPAGTTLTSYDLTFFGEETFFLHGATAPPATQNVTFTIPGTYTITLNVGDDAGGSAATSELVIQVS